ncbi:hypothetical protein ACIQPR_39260 [Streptomyces sp. NPDC091280]|uniref:hypothetical protein n=1 Tax=Streptomyces sp. NPDC091280 TaxID=3365984 RepID=UPI003803B071
MREATDRFPQTYGVKPAGAVLVRPYGFAAWRADAPGPDDESTLRRTHALLLDGTAPAARA